jgi:nucleotide-binding universal stress UspA family protein
MFGRSAPSGLDVTLMHVIESVPEHFTARGGAQSPEAFRKLAQECLAHDRTTGQELLQKSHRSLEQAGVASSAVHDKLVVKESLPEARRVVAAQAIIEEMRQQPYDVVVIGRRGTSPAAESFLGGVAEKVVREAKGKTVWVVD